MSGPIAWLLTGQMPFYMWMPNKHCQRVTVRHSEDPPFRRSAIPKVLDEGTRVTDWHTDTRPAYDNSWSYRVRVRVSYGLGRTGPSEWRTFGMADPNRYDPKEKLTKQEILIVFSQLLDVFVWNCRPEIVRVSVAAACVAAALRAVLVHGSRSLLPSLLSSAALQCYAHW